MNVHLLNCFGIVNCGLFGKPQNVQKNGRFFASAAAGNLIITRLLQRAWRCNTSRFQTSSGSFFKDVLDSCPVLLFSKFGAGQLIHSAYLHTNLA